MDSFEQIADNLFRCKTCGEEVPSGIFNISGHWANCTGKGFSLALLEKAKAGPLTVDMVRYNYLKYKEKTYKHEEKESITPIAGVEPQNAGVK